METSINPSWWDLRLARGSRKTSIYNSIPSAWYYSVYRAIWRHVSMPLCYIVVMLAYVLETKKLTGFAPYSRWGRRTGSCTFLPLIWQWILVYSVQESVPLPMPWPGMPVG